MPTSGAIGRARLRLGPEPLKVLFGRVCRPVATGHTVGAWYHRWRLVAVDGTVFDLADTDANTAHFGRPGSGRGDKRGAFPQARVAALVTDQLAAGVHFVAPVPVAPARRGVGGVGALRRGV